ncbi:MAG: hypothetical protein SNF33_02140 [Candidatus Algichlamydia australiensis]|nr:hypothetical protein [Chlamydiales bacterium]
MGLKTAEAVYSEFRNIAHDAAKELRDEAQHDLEKTENWAAKTINETLPKLRSIHQELKAREVVPDDELNTYGRFGIQAPDLTLQHLRAYSGVLSYNKEKAQAILELFEKTATSLKAEATKEKVQEFIISYRNLFNKIDEKPKLEDFSPICEKPLFANQHAEMKAEMETHNKTITTTLEAAAALVNESGAEQSDNDEKEIERERTKWAVKHQELSKNWESANALLKRLEDAIDDLAFPDEVIKQFEGVIKRFEGLHPATRKEIEDALKATEKLSGELKTWKEEVKKQIAELNSTLATAAKNIGFDQDEPSIFARIGRGVGVFEDTTKTFKSGLETLANMIENYDPAAEDAEEIATELNTKFKELTDKYNALPVRVRTEYHEEVNKLTTAIQQVEIESNFAKNAKILEESLHSFSEKGVDDEQKESLKKTLKSLETLFSSLTEEQQVRHQEMMTDLKTRTETITDPKQENLSIWQRLGMA